MTEAVRRSVMATSAIALGTSAMLMLTAVPGNADTEGPGSRASASALNVDAAGKSIDVTNQFTAVYNGVEQITAGTKAPAISEQLAAQKIFVGGVLSQDAFAGTGFSAACAGLVGRDGVVKVGPNKSCLVSNNNGKVEISLGTLPKLGLSDTLAKLPTIPGLPDLDDLPGLPEIPGLPIGGDPTSVLPNAELRIVGEALTARCYSSAYATEGSANTAHAKLVAVFGDKKVKLADITPAGLVLTPTQLIAKVRDQLPAEAGAVLDQLDTILAKVPTDQLPQQDAVNIKLGEQDVEGGNITVSALHARVGAPSNVPLPVALPVGAPGLDLYVGKVTCTAARLYGSTEGPQKSDGPNSLSGKASGSAKAGSGKVSGGVSGSAKELSGDVKANLDGVPGAEEIQKQLEETTKQVQAALMQALALVGAA